MTNLAGSIAGAFDSEIATETLIERVDAPTARFPLLASMFIERGDRKLERER